MSTTYTEIPAAEVPKAIVWHTPRRNQNQMVEYSYSRGIPAGQAADMEADNGDPWMRVTDRSAGTVTYHKRQG